MPAEYNIIGVILRYPLLAKTHKDECLGRLLYLYTAILRSPQFSDVPSCGCNTTYLLTQGNTVYTVQSVWTMPSLF